MKKRTIAVLMAGLMALAVLSSAGVVAAAPQKQIDVDTHRDGGVGARELRFPLYLEPRDEQHKFVGTLTLKKISRDDFRWTIVTFTPVKRGTYDLKVESQLGWHRFGPDKLVKDDVKVTKDGRVFKTGTIEAWKVNQVLKVRNPLFELEKNRSDRDFRQTD